MLALDHGSHNARVCQREWHDLPYQINLNNDDGDDNNDAYVNGAYFSYILPGSFTCKVDRSRGLAFWILYNVEWRVSIISFKLSNVTQITNKLSCNET